MLALCQRSAKNGRAPPRIRTSVADLLDILEDVGRHETDTPWCTTNAAQKPLDVVSRVGIDSRGDPSRVELDVVRCREEQATLGFHSRERASRLAGIETKRGEQFFGAILSPRGPNSRDKGQRLADCQLTIEGRHVPYVTDVRLVPPRLTDDRLSFQATDPPFNPN